MANHPSWIDPLALASVMPESFRFVAVQRAARKVVLDLSGEADVE